MRMVTTVMAIALVGMWTSGVALAGDAAAGKARSATCVGCHGANGISNLPMYPNLAGQKEDYLVASLRAYKSGERSNATMKAMAVPLSDADIANLAAYYAGMACK